MTTPHAAGRRWPASLAVGMVLVAHLVVPPAVQVGPIWLLPTVTALLLVPVVVANPGSLRRDHDALRALALASATAVAVLNAAVLLSLLVTLLSRPTLSPRDLILTAAVLLTTNVVAVAVLLWELDGGGPFARHPDHGREAQRPDLLFPQLGTPGVADPDWKPSFVDYLFTSFTVTTAFSPTDTMPLTARVKVVFMMGAAVAMLTFALVAARAVNLL